MLDGRLKGKRDEFHAIGSRRRSHPYAPFWSWASIACDYSIRFDCQWGPGSYEYIARVLEVSGEPVNTANPFGPLLSGFVKVKAFAARLPSHLTWRGDPVTNEDIRIEGYTLTCLLSLDVTNPAFEISSMDEIVVLPILYDACDVYTHLQALCLKESEDKQSFRRVGNVHFMSPRDRWRSNPRTLQEMIPNMEAWASVLKALEETITII
jgi:hypothetical protein